MTAAAAVLAWQGLALQYRRGPLLRFPDLSVLAGAHLLLRGESGSGKSSLLSLLAGLRVPSAGQVWLAGRALGAMSATARDAWRGRMLGVLPQRLHLCEGLSLRENLQLPGLAQGMRVPPARLHSLAERLGLGGLLERPVHQLSGGQAQRAALARALLAEPPLLLLDEPSSSLDDRATTELLALATELARESGCSLVVATHDARVVQGLQAALGAQLQTLTLASPT